MEYNVEIEHFSFKRNVFIPFYLQAIWIGRKITFHHCICIVFTEYYSGSDSESDIDSELFIWKFFHDVTVLISLIRDGDWMTNSAPLNTTLNINPYYLPTQLTGIEHAYLVFMFTTCTYAMTVMPTKITDSRRRSNSRVCLIEICSLLLLLRNSGQTIIQNILTCNRA